MYLHVNTHRVRVTQAVKVRNLLTSKTRNNILNEARVGNASHLSQDDFRTPPLAPVDAEAVACLVRGMGNYWTFGIHHFGSAGMPPTNPGLGSNVINTNGKATGINSFTLTSGFHNWTHMGMSQKVSRYARAWTLVTAHKESGTWKHKAIRSDGVKVLNGAVTVGSLGSLGVSVSAFVVGVTVNTTEQLAMMLFVPYLMPTEWIQDIYNNFYLLNRHYPSLPFLTVNGEHSIEQTPTGFQKFTGSVQQNTSVSFDRRAVDFTLHQVRE